MQHAPNHPEFENLFDYAPISLWLEDFSALKVLFEAWRAQGVVDLRSHLAQSPKHAEQCAQCYHVLQVNRKTLEVFAAKNQEELVGRLDEVFRDDMYEPMVAELCQLWSGSLAYSSQSVNYALDGRRMDVQLDVRILPGHEADWSRVMVSVQDNTEKMRAGQRQAESERHARNLFDLSPVSLWVEDFSGVKRLMDEARAGGIRDFRVFLSVHQEFVGRCMEEIKVLDVNQQTLDMFGAANHDDLLSHIDQVFRDEMQVSFADQLLDLWHGKLAQTREVVNYSINGDLINIHMQFAVMPGHEADWDLVLVSLVDITARKKAEAYLEYLGQHDSLTRLRNRAFYVEELNRITRKGPWPLSVLALDLNCLKTVNDNQGHVAGDALLRRAGEVLKSATEGQPFCAARIGGDEFIVLLPGSDERVALSLQERIESMLELNNQFYPGQKLSMAIGTAICRSAVDVEKTLHEADQAMFKAKRSYYEQHKLERRK
jgi:diguanylate cyclase (GGDEF)-like protein